MKILAKSDTGMVRSSNQDAYAAGEFRDGVAWAVVCDGMGGNAGGNIASSTAVRSISQRITTAYRDNMSPASIRNLLITAITNSNIEIYDMAEATPKLRGMGTTVVAVIVGKNTVYIAHAGDSRAYLISQHAIRQVTRDHSVVQKMVESGEITEEQALNHPNRNLITRALGVSENIQVDYGEEDLHGGEVVFICTDGLTNFVTDEEIQNLVMESTDSDCANSLVDLANAHGGGDNITVVVIAE